MFRPSNLFRSLTLVGLFTFSTLQSMLSFAQCGATIDFDYGEDTICVSVAQPLVDASSSPNGIANWQWFANGGQLPGGSPTSSFFPVEEGIYEIMLTITDGFGCDQSHSETIVVLGNPSVSASATDMSCHGVCDGQAEIIFDSPNAGAYTATWLSTSQTTPLTDQCAGVYTANITDDFGCTLVPYTSTAQIFEPAELVATVLNGQDIYACSGGPEIQLNLDITGGTVVVTSYQITWTPATGLSDVNAEDPSLSPIAGNMFATFTATVTDNNGCIATDEVTLFPSVSQVQGEITVGGVPCTACEVYILKQTISDWDTIAQTPTDAAGEYFFQAVPGMTAFRLMTDPDNAAHPNALQTYYDVPDPTYLWEDAFVLNTGCATLTQKDIEVIVPPTQEGQCTLSGTLWSYSGPGKLQVALDPIPLIDVVVEKTPPGTPQGKSTTDVNGEFEFNFMEVDAAIYTLYVNLPGLPMMETYSITIDPNDLLYAQLDLCVDTASGGIYRCGTLGAEEVEPNDMLTTIYPNPNNGDFMLITGAFEGQDMTLQLVDISGRAIYTTSMTNAPGRLAVNGVSPGYYLMLIQSSSGRQTLPVSVLGL